jgi:PAS domain S-box-containing protein
MAENEKLSVSTRLYKGLFQHLKTGLAISRAHLIAKRKRAEEALRKSEARFQAIFENAAIGIALVDMHGHPVESNPALQTMLGYSKLELAQKAFTEFTHPADSQADWSLFTELVEGRRDRYQLDKRFYRKDGQIVWGRLSASLVRSQKGEPKYALRMVEDISNRKQAEEALRVSEARFRALSECAAAAIFIYQGNRFLYANPAMEVITGYSLDELLGMSFWEIAHPDVRERVRERELALQRREPAPLRYEIEIVTKAGEECWLEFSGARFELQGRLAVVGIAFDVTERKRVEGKLRDLVGQLHALADRLQTVREEEKIGLAREIHDELGQALTAIKIDLGSIFRELGDNAKPLAGAPASILKLVDQTIRTVRRIASQLRPGILDNLGLPAAIEWATEEFQDRTGIKCHLEMQEAGIVLDRERTTAVFRIFQETLTNVARHSGATELQVRLLRQNANTILEVRDNGVGMQLQHLTGTESLGILGMRERALFLGGQFEIAGRPGEGTTVSVSIPDPSPAVGA